MSLSVLGLACSDNTASDGTSDSQCLTSGCNGDELSDSGTGPGGGSSGGSSGDAEACMEGGSACEENEDCVGGTCVPLCELIMQSPSSVGCSFFANRMDNQDNNKPDSLVIGNVSSSKSVTAQLYLVPVNQDVEQALGAPVVVGPKGTHTFELDHTPIESVTNLRHGGVYRIETTIPIVAYLHSPIGAQRTNDASMLLPEHALTGSYVVASYPGTFQNEHYPSYFTAIATQDDTTFEFLAGGPTAGGGGVPAVAEGESTQVMLKRYDTLNVVVAAQYQDLSGTIVTADKPVWLAGATECANVPAYPTSYCDHIEEVMLPLEYWGKEYVGAHAPQRGDETFHWRVYGGVDGITVDTMPPQPGFPLQLDKGEFYQFTTLESFLFTGNGPFMPVQLLEGQNGGAGTGDPSMYQMVPTEQYLDTYAFVTGSEYTKHYAQIIRPAGGDDVLVDDVVVGDYYQVGDWEISDHPIGQGGHFATSTQPFGVLQVGYTSATSYAYPGGLRLAVINPQ